MSCVCQLYNKEYMMMMAWKREGREGMERGKESKKMDERGGR